MTVLVVDGYNAIYAIPDVRRELEKSLEAARKRIIGLSSEYVKRSGYIDSVKVVFDGNDRYRHLDHIDMNRVKVEIFSSTGKGDDKIIEVVRKYSSCGKVILASNDNYVRNNARAYGAGLMHVNELEKTKVKRAQKKSEDKDISPSIRDAITKEYRKKLGL